MESYKLDCPFSSYIYNQFSWWIIVPTCNIKGWQKSCYDNCILVISGSIKVSFFDQIHQNIINFVYAETNFNVWPKNILIWFSPSDILAVSGHYCASGQRQHVVGGGGWQGANVSNYGCDIVTPTSFSVYDECGLSVAHLVIRSQSKYWRQFSISHTFMYTFQKKHSNIKTFEFNETSTAKIIPSKN